MMPHGRRAGTTASAAVGRRGRRRRACRARALTCHPAPRPPLHPHLVPQEGGAADVKLQQRAPSPAAAGQLLDPKVQHPPREVLHLRHIHLRAAAGRRRKHGEAG